MSEREILIVAHTGREENIPALHSTVTQLRGAGVTPWLMEGEHHDVGAAFDAARATADLMPKNPELVFVLGGDGTILRAAELCRPLGLPLAGVNLGSIGFLAETEREALPKVVQHLIDGEYRIDERLTIDVAIRLPSGEMVHSWAVNEATVEKTDRGQVLEVVTEVDGHPVSAFGGDGVVLATPTGSTAYGFSAGGPVIWPDVEALLMVPICAHALFARPLVAAPDSVLAVEVVGPEVGGIVACDGRRRFAVPPGSRIEVTRSGTPLKLARFAERTFTDRLVRKFRLPVTGWRGPRKETP